MEDGKQKKPRTIKMRYPAQYSQSWNETEQTPRVTKNKSKVQNTNTSRAPPPSHSWANERASNRAKRKNSPRGDTQRATEPFVEACCHAKPRVRGPDPTAPHLKYGLFPPKRITNKSQAQVVSATGRKSRTSTAESSKRDKIEKTEKEPPCEDPPLLVFRAIDPRHSRRLRVSAPAHLDIRPRKYDRR